MTTRFIKKTSPGKCHWGLYASVAFILLHGLLSVVNAEYDFLPPEWKERNDLLIQPVVVTKDAPHRLLLDIYRVGTRLVAVGERGHIVYSDDSGRNWYQAEVPVQVTLTAVHFPDVQHGWAVGHDGVILHTKDGGQTWVKQLSGREGGRLNLAHARRLLEESEDELSDRVEDLEWKLAYWEEESERWGNPLLDVWFKNQTEGFVIGAYGRFFETRDGGETWLPAWDRIENPDKWHLNAIGASKDTIFIAGEAGMLYRSRDGGKSWESLESPYEGSYLGIIASPENEFVLAFGIGARVARSTDIGKTWELFQTEAGAALSGGTVLSDGTVLVVSYSGAILTGKGDQGAFTTKRVRGTWNAVVRTGDNHIVIAGRRGIHRMPF